MALRPPLRVAVLATVAVAVGVWAGVARAGYAIQPAPGATTGPQPTFLVYLDAQDSLAQVYVATTPDMLSGGYPANEVGSCTPTTPFGEANKYTCQPGYYSPTFTSSLAPGTYYWWMSFWRTDPDHPYGSQQISGPFAFTVAQPTAPADSYLVSPADGATVQSTTPKVTMHAPAGVGLRFYISDTNVRFDDGSPAGSTLASCAGTTSNAGDYYCLPAAGSLYQGGTYYWWVIVTANGGSWVYGPRSFSVSAASPPPPPPPPPSTGGGGGSSQPHSLAYAPYLPSSTHFTGRSIKNVRLTQAAYALSKFVGAPKTVAVACWSAADWSNISGDNPESTYSILGLWSPDLPRWVNLSPSICHTFETLIYHRPAYANVFTANALDTLTHEMIHALGVHNEAKTECLAMQLDFITGDKMGLPMRYAENLDRLSLRNYFSHPPKYVDTARCREGGEWDVFPNSPSLPWHMPSF